MDQHKSTVKAFLSDTALIWFMAFSKTDQCNCKQLTFGADMA